MVRCELQTRRGHSLSDSAVNFEHVSKRFSRGLRVRTLAEAILGWPRRALRRRNEQGLLDHEFWALNDVSFEVPKGEMLGIVGPNGSGKSTILKLLFRILRPDKGIVRVNGRVGGLIELGAGFHPYLSGRENVSINGAILGMTRREIREKYESIVDFAGVREFMDMQVKNYSSGMYARLAFAVAAHAKPDVLLVDEVLAVGDSAFQMKCYDWMGQQRKRGTTIVLVSHSMYVIGAADRCIYLQAGNLRRIGPAREVSDQYQAELLAQRGKDNRSEIQEGERGQRIERVQLLDKSGREIESIGYEQDVRVRIYYDCARPLTWPVFDIGLFHDDPRYPVQIPHHYLFCAFSGETFKDATITGKGYVEVALDCLRLPVGVHRLKAILFEQHYTTPLFIWDGAARVEVMRPAWSDGRSLIDCRQHWSAPIEVKIS